MPDVQVNVEDRIAVVTMNRPDKLNAVTPDMARRLVDVLHEMRNSDEVRAVVLTGAGRAFCAGADIAAGGLDQNRLERKAPVGVYPQVTRAIVDLDKPIISALHGPVAGLGLSYAVATDRRFADDTTRITASWIKRGLHPDCGVSFFLPKIAGLSVALRMLMTGVTINAEEALRTGVVDELVGAGEALLSAMDYARELATGPSIAIDLVRRGVLKSLTNTLDQALDYEAFAVSATRRTADRKEGIEAFLEGREPSFKGE